MSLTPATRKIMLEGYRLPVDIGFHASEIGDPQMLELTVEVWARQRGMGRRRRGALGVGL